MKILSESWTFLFTLCRRICHLPQNLLLAVKKRGIARFFVKFTSNSRFFGILFISITYKTNKI